MTKVRYAVALSGLLGLNAPALAQDVSVHLSLSRGPVRIAGHYVSLPHYAIPQPVHCEREGAFLYCWDPLAYRFAHPIVVQVYPASPRVVVVERRYRDRDAKYWRKEARKALRRWRREHRRADERVTVVLAWER